MQKEGKRNEHSEEHAIMAHANLAPNKVYFGEGELLSPLLKM